MARSHLLLGGLLGVLLAGGVAVRGLDRPPDHGPVYTVAQVQDQLARNPAGWVGKTVLVRGITEGCLPSGSPGSVRSCHQRPQDLHDPGQAGASERLPLVWGSPGPWLAVLRRLPVVSRLLPPRQTPQWGVVATYRVQFRAVPASICTDRLCDEALLLDAAP